jgi:hypothetical protein
LVGEAVAAHFATVLVAPGVVGDPLELAEPVATCRGPLADEPVAGPREPDAGLLVFPHRALQVVAGGFVVADLLAQQRHAEFGEVQPHAVALPFQPGPAVDGTVVAVGCRDERLQGLELVLRPPDGGVGLGEILEVTDNRLHPLGGVGRLEHVVADELGEVADRLHRHRLVEQVQGLFRTDAQQLAHPAGVVGVAGGDLRTRRPEPTPQLAQVRAEVGEVRFDREPLLRGDEEPVGLTGAVLLVEHLGEGDGLVGCFVEEHPEYHGVRAVVTQPDRPGRAGALVALRLVVAFHVAAEGALLALRPRRLVVRDPVRGQQQGGERVDERRLPAADVTGEQRGVAAERQPPHPLVERAPVEQLDLVEAVSRPPPTRQRTDRDLRVSHRPRPRSRLRRTRAASRRSPTGSGRRRRP